MKFELMELIDYVETYISNFEYKYINGDSGQAERFNLIKDSFDDLKKYLEENK